MANQKGGYCMANHEWGDQIANEGWQIKWPISIPDIRWSIRMGEIRSPIRMVSYFTHQFFSVGDGVEVFEVFVGLARGPDSAEQLGQQELLSLCSTYTSASCYTYGVAKYVKYNAFCFEDQLGIKITDCCICMATFHLSFKHRRYRLNLIKLYTQKVPVSKFLVYTEETSHNISIVTDAIIQCISLQGTLQT